MKRVLSLFLICAIAMTVVGIMGTGTVSAAVTSDITVYSEKFPASSTNAIKAGTYTPANDGDSAFSKIILADKGVNAGEEDGLLWISEQIANPNGEGKIKNQNALAVFTFPTVTSGRVNVKFAYDGSNNDENRWEGTDMGSLVYYNEADGSVERAAALYKDWGNNGGQFMHYTVDGNGVKQAVGKSPQGATGTRKLAIDYTVDFDAKTYTIKTDSGTGQKYTFGPFALGENKKANAIYFGLDNNNRLSNSNYKVKDISVTIEDGRKNEIDLYGYNGAYLGKDDVIDGHTPTAPNVEGKVFMGWYAEAEFVTLVTDFESYEGTAIYAKYKDANVKNENYRTEGIYADFKDDYLKSGNNILNITGENLSGEEMQVCVVFALYDKDDVLVKTKVGEQNTIGVSEKIAITETFDLTGMDISGKKVRAFIWKNMSTMVPVAMAISPTQTAFTFTLSQGATTSAGVYDAKDRLVRTLWSAVYKDAGTHTSIWDGLDDYGNSVPDGDYQVKVLTNNVIYDKLIPVIGNTTDCSTWSSYLSSYSSIFDMAYDPVLKRYYYCSDHVEGGAGLRYLNSDGNGKVILSKNGGLVGGSTNLTATHTASDGQRVYWGATEFYWQSSGEYKAFVYATVKDDSITSYDDLKYKFEYGTEFQSKWEKEYVYNAINIYGQTGTNRISGLEVQQSGNLLFSAFRDKTNSNGGVGEVIINDKNTGEVLGNIAINSPTAMAMSRGNDGVLYVAYQNGENYSIAKYNVNGNTMIKDRDVITGRNIILALAVSPDGQSLAFAEGGSEDKVHICDTTDYAITKSFGSGESYITDPTVKADKLMFDDKVFGYTDPYEHSFLEFENDDSLLMGDSGNTRIYKLNISSASPEITDMAMFQANNYNTSVVANDITRIFCETKEYSIDYAKMEDYVAKRANKYDYAGFENAWKLEKNYYLYLENKFDLQKDGAETRFFRPYKAENGYTYFGMDRTNIFMQEPNGEIHDTGVSLSWNDLHPDGSIWTHDSKGKYYKYDLTYAADGTPIPGEKELLADVSDTYASGHNPTSYYTQLAVLEDGRMVVHDSPGPVQGNYPEIRMSLGVVDVTGETVATDFDWVAAPLTVRQHENDFPKDGYLDIGNSVWYTTRYAISHKDNIILHYRGEGWKAKQANSFLHFSDNGLLVGVFGRNLKGRGEDYEGYDGTLKEVEPCNSFSVSIAEVPGTNGDVAYIFQNSEGAAGGVHITRVTGLNSIKELEPINITLRNGLVPGISYTCYDSNNLDVLKIAKKGVANNFDIPFITEETGTDRSVRFEGYYIPKFTGTHKFKLETDGTASVIIDYKTRVSKTQNTEFTHYMEKDRMYKFTVEVSPSEENGLSYIDVLYLNDGIYYSLSSANVRCLYPREMLNNSVNMLDGFTFGAKFTDGEYGWKINGSGTDSSRENVARVTLNKWNYRYDQIPDIYIDLKAFSGKGDVSVSRSIDNISGSNWKIDMDVRYTGNTSRKADVFSRPNSGDGSSIEVLDAAGKVIADFNIYHNGTNHNFIIYGNGKQLLTDTKTCKDEAGHNFAMFSVGVNQNQIVVTPQRLIIEPNGINQIKISYAGTEIIADVRETGADITSPTSIRFVAYNKYSGYRTNQWNITRFDLIRDTTK